MSQKPVSNESLLNMPYLDQVDFICDQFEQDWKANRKPDVRDYAILAAPRYRERVLRELILTERECVLYVKIDLWSFSDSAELKSTDTRPASLENGKSDTKVEPSAGARHEERLLPSHIDRYLIRRVLGEGSHGVVYEAEDVEIRKPVALKVNKLNASTGRSLEREAAIASRIEHPAIVSVLSSGQFGDHHYLVTELVRGVNLKQFTKEQAVEPNLAVEIMIQIANAMSVAHQSGVVHRDLKPSNIMVVSNQHFVNASSEPSHLSTAVNGSIASADFTIRILDSELRRATIA